jgi:hypothetical protein
VWRRGQQKEGKKKKKKTLEFNTKVQNKTRFISGKLFYFHVFFFVSESRKRYKKEM